MVRTNKWRVDMVARVSNFSIFGSVSNTLHTQWTIKISVFMFYSF